MPFPSEAFFYTAIVGGMFAASPKLAPITARLIRAEVTPLDRATFRILSWFGISAVISAGITFIFS